MHPGLARVVAAFAVAAAGFVLVHVPGVPGASACSGPLADARRAVETAPVVALVRVTLARGPEHERSYVFTVEEAFKGAVLPELETEPLPWHACGDRIAAAVGDRLVIAFDAKAWDAGPAVNPYWTVAPDGTVDAAGIDATGLGWSTIDDLRAGMRDRFPDGGSIAQPEPVGEPGSGGGLSDATVALAAATLGVAVVVLVGAVLVARRSGVRR